MSKQNISKNTRTNSAETVKHFINNHVSVDCVVFGFDDDKLKVLLIQQKFPGKKGADEYLRYALPGDLVFEDESLDTAAQRVLKELTMLEGIYLRQFMAFGDPSRVNGEKDKEWLKIFRTEPDARVITIAYFAVVKMEDFIPGAGSFAEKSIWCDINEVPELAFDHTQIFNTGLERLRQELLDHHVGFELLPEKFTLSQLQKLYEVILGKSLDKRNFRKSILKMNHITSLDEKQKGVYHKPAQLYKFSKRKKNS